MRIAALALAVLAACGTPGRGEHVVTWSPHAMALDSSGLYAFLPPGQLARVRPGQDIEVLATDATAGNVIPGGVALTEGEILYGAWGTALGEGSLRAVSKSGGAIRTLATAQSRPSDLQHHAGDVYWTTIDFPPEGGSSKGSLRAMPVAGGSIRTLISEQSAAYHGFAVDSERVYFAQTDTSRWFGGPPATPFVGSVAKDGTGLAVLAPDDVACCVLRVDGRLLWIAASSPRELRALALPSKAQTTVAKVGDSAWWMAADERGTFVVLSWCPPCPPDTNCGHCSSLLRNVTTGEELASADSFAMGVWLDESHVYWLVANSYVYRVKR